MLRADRFRVDWRGYESRLERILVGAGLSLVALAADLLMRRRLHR